MDVIELLEDLVAIDSTNRSIDPAGAGEQAMAERLVAELTRLGFTVDLTEVAQRRSCTSAGCGCRAPRGRAPPA